LDALYGSDQSHDLSIKFRQGLGAKYARDQRTSKIDAAIENALKHLRIWNKPITISAIAKLAAVSRTTIYQRRCSGTWERDQAGFRAAIF
jgi:hypothetical protein